MPYCVKYMEIIRKFAPTYIKIYNTAVAKNTNHNPIF